MSREFEELKNAPYPHADDIDRKALQFTKSWHRHPALHDALWYRGINLGELDEFVLMQEVVRILVEQEDGGAP